MTPTKNVAIKHDTRDHKGFFIQEGDYELMGIDKSGWALICVNETSCHYVDPDDLEASVG